MEEYTDLISPKSGLWEAIAEGIFDVKPNTFFMKPELIEHCDMYPQYWVSSIGGTYQKEKLL